MSSHSKSHLSRFLAILPAMIAPVYGLPRWRGSGRPAPKWELYGGYSFRYPGADVRGILPGELLPLTSRMESNPRGAGAASPITSIAGSASHSMPSTIGAAVKRGSEQNRRRRFINLSLGPKFTFRSAHFSPFLEWLAGDHRLYPEAFRHINKFGFMFGGGLDINLSRHVALRLFRADYVMSSYRYGPSTTTPSTDLRGVRLQTGLNFMFGGGAPPVSPSVACSIQPAEVFAGEPVTATASDPISIPSVQSNTPGVAQG